MQNRKEDFIEFVKTIKKKVHDWWVSYNRKLWTTHIFVYGGLLLLVIFVGAFTFAHFHLFHTDADSARYMLSALVQSQAAIVAIVITLTLIAVQLTASAYSPRVIDIFKKNPDMWILLGFYGASIFYGFIVLKLVEGEFVSQSTIWSLGPISISFEFCVSLAYWLGVFTFVVLFPYMLNIIGLLKSENIIKRLAIDITGDKILNHIDSAKTSEGVKISAVDDPVQPIVDIIHGSIMKYDLETTGVGLNAVTERIIGIIDSYCKKDILDRKRNLSEHFCGHLRRVGQLAVSREDEESAEEVVKNLEKFGKSTAEKSLGFPTEEAARSLGEIGKAAAKKGLDYATGRAARSLGGVGEAAAKNCLDRETVEAAKFLEEVGKAAAENGLDYATGRAAVFLGNVGEAAARKGLENATWLTAESLEVVGKAAAWKWLYDATETAAWSLGKVGEATAKNGLDYATGRAAGSLGKVGEAAAENGLEIATWQTAKSLGEVGKAAAEQGLEDATGRAAESLEVVGKAAAEKGLDFSIGEAAEALGEVGKAAAEKDDLVLAMSVAAKALAELTLSSEKSVKTGIQNYESILEEQYRATFQKFMKIYEQKLEKLRAEKNQNKKTKSM